MFCTNYVQLDCSKEIEVFNLTDDPERAFVTSDSTEAMLLSRRFGGHVVTRQPTKQETQFWWEH